MHRPMTVTLAALVAALALSAPSYAGEKDLQRQVDQLRKKIEALQAQTVPLLEEEVERYLDGRGAQAGAQGADGLAGIAISARFTAVGQGTVGLDPANRHAANGDVDLDFDFQVTDNLSLFVYLTANEGAESSNGGFPSIFGPITSPSGSFPAIAGTTFAGATDGQGVNGTVPTDPGSITVYEAGIYHVLPVGDYKLHWEAGTIDPRRRFNQNAFADDENTQFIHNSFDDTAAHLWLTDAVGGRTVFGWHGWMSFGDNDQITVNWGWFNTPGQFFNDGQFLAQISWRGEVAGREMNVRLMFGYDQFFQSGSEDSTFSYGASADWWATDMIGVFLRIVTNTDDVNLVELDVSFGFVVKGLLGNRPDDALGLGIGIINANDAVTSAPEDTEVTIELYYRYMAEDGKLQITPHLIIVSDPGGNASPWEDDLLVILGLRLHVPF